MSFVTRLISLLSLLVLAACGGGGGDLAPFGAGASSPGTGNGGGGGGTAAVADLDVQLSQSTIPNTGVGTVTATVTALDVNRNAIPGAAVTLSANSGAVVTIQGTSGSVTDSSGRLTATVGIGSDGSNRDITVTASAGSVTRSAILKVVNSPAGATPTAIEIIAGATTVGTGGDGVQIRAFVKDANNNAMVGAPVAFSTSTGTLSAVSAVTDASGVATATFSAGADKANRTAVIRVDSATVSSTISLPITGTRLTLSGPSSLIRGNSAGFDIVVTDSRGNVVPGVTVTAASSLGNAVTPANGVSNANGQVSFTYTATNPGSDALTFSGAGATASPSPALAVSGQTFSFVAPAASTTIQVNAVQTLRVRLQGVTPLAGQTIQFAATGGTLSAASATTDAQGEATVNISSSSAGPLTVQATVAGGGATTTLPLVVVATVPHRLVLQVTPTALPPNSGTGTSNQAQVVAKVTDPAGNPVQGLTVNFTRVADPSGGNLLQASSTTDASGQAIVAYRSGSESTANNGVVLRASVASAPAVSGQATLTVNQTALFIALGTGNVIGNLDPQTYKKDWVVYVTDANGIAVNGATLTIKALPTHYLTGELAWNGVAYSYAAPPAYCPNEDDGGGVATNANNGILDPGEDKNGDGVLWPGNVIAVSPSTVQTVDGRATISLTYAESFAPWVRLRLTASATVAGTESRNDVEFVVSGSSEDFTNQAVPPAGVDSPFGLVPRGGAVCSTTPP